MLRWMSGLIGEARRWWRNQRAIWRVDSEPGVWLWVDDERPAPDGWYWAKTVDEAADVLESTIVERLSLDHDLGSGGEAYNLVKWLAEMREAHGLNFWPRDRPRVHSMNPVGRTNMEAVIDRYGGYRQAPFWHRSM